MKLRTVGALFVVTSVSIARMGWAEDRIAPQTLQFLEATTISGYIESSYVFNPKEGLSKAAGVNVLRAFDNNTEFTLNAVKLVLEKPLGEGDWAAGYRVDLLFGQDATVLGASSRSSLSVGGGGVVEQGYVNFRVPVGNGVEIKFGKFVTMHGYEVIESPANLNFSRSLLFTWAVPVAHTGAMASYKFNDFFDAQLGVVNGWNNNVDDNSDPAVHWRVGFTSPKSVFTFAATGIYGRDLTLNGTAEPRTLTGGTSERWVVDLISTWNVTDKFLLGANFDYGHQTGAGALSSGKVIPADWWGVAGYAQLKPNDRINFVLRGEYFDDQEGFTTDTAAAPAAPAGQVGLFGQKVDVWEVTGTININVWKNLLIRVEARYDQANRRIFNKLDDQVTLAVDAVYSF